VIENGAFLVEGDVITRVGTKGDVKAPAGVTRIDLSGQTVIPGMVLTHGHIGYLRGTTFARENYTRENLIDHLDRYLYYGVVAMASTGTDPGDLPFEIRNSPHPGALFRTAGPGFALPGASTGNLAMRSVPYGVTTEEEARAKVRELAAKKPDFVKVWVDDRNGAVKKLPPPIYRAIIDEAHKHGLRVVVHVYYLADARDLVEAGADGFLHLVRDEEMDAALVARMKAKKMFVTPNLSTSEAGTYTNTPAWLDDPLLAESATPAMIKKVSDVYAARAGGQPRIAAVSSYQKQQRSLARLNAAGVTIALGDDTGIENTFYGYGEHHELELMVQAGMTPMQVINRVDQDRRGAAEAGQARHARPRQAGPTSSSSTPTRSENIGNTKKIAKVYQRGTEVDRVALRRTFLP
jgi:imidazolonepropionase-like amidohydrolase